jgi:DNA-3-methyladenine glycosylase II
MAYCSHLLQQMPTPTQFTVRIDGPIDYSASLEMFCRAGDDLIDRWDGRIFIRTISIGARAVAYACTFKPVLDALDVHVMVEDFRHCDDIENLVRSMFVMPSSNLAELRAADRVIDALNNRYPGVYSVRQQNLFGALIRCITTQQVNLRWAATCRRRLAETFGHLHAVGTNFVYSLDAARFAGLEVRDIRALQLTNSKAEYIIQAARTITSEELTIASIDELTDEEIIARLTAIRGIGLWTAEWILARTLGRPRVVAGDLGVRKAVGIAYCGGVIQRDSEVRRITEHWGNSAAIAQALLLHALAEKTLTEVVANLNADGAITPTAATIPIRQTSARSSVCASPRKP